MLIKMRVSRVKNEDGGANLIEMMVEKESN